VTGRFATSGQSPAGSGGSKGRLSALSLRSRVQGFGGEGVGGFDGAGVFFAQRAEVGGGLVSIVSTCWTLAGHLLGPTPSWPTPSQGQDIGGLQVIELEQADRNGWDLKAATSLDSLHRVLDPGHL